MAVDSDIAHPPFINAHACRPAAEADLAESRLFGGRPPSPLFSAAGPLDSTRGQKPRHVFDLTCGRPPFASVCDVSDGREKQNAEIQSDGRWASPPIPSISPQTPAAAMCLMRRGSPPPRRTARLKERGQPALTGPRHASTPPSRGRSSQLSRADGAAEKSRQRCTSLSR
jgi:hypothetical protein